MKTKPNLSFRQLWNLSFGFFGVQIAYALQSANISRIFATLGADPHQLSFFWILPPLMGMVVQPLIGYFSDRTWCRFGRRIPYLFIGALIAVAVMVLLPNAGSLGLTTQIVLWGLSGTMLFGLFSLMLLDTSINIAMQPFKMMVGDMVNEEQKGKAYSIQSFLCNAGSLVGYLFPYFFTYIGVKNVAPEGVIPNSVIYSFYIGAAILILCVIYTTLKVKEWPPQEFAEYNDASLTEASQSAPQKKSGSVGSTFLTIGLVQFFCWAAFMYMWTYTPGAIADNCWGTTDPASAGYQEAANWVGVVFAIQAIGSVIWAAIIPSFGTNYRTAYVVSLCLGAVGFISCQYIHNQYVLFLPFLLIGCAWAAMLALPFTLFTNALQGNPKMGTYLGLFNCTICLPQIVAAVLGGQILKHIAGGSQPMMLLIAGVLLLLAALSVPIIKSSKA
ncbi:MAG: SLC45 family MFS transporter [Prevotella sp.]|nr:SLC45 family MFS transporter [Prevotella sp.]MBR2203549.1 SLC45 family MFS transporter [Prevotella sp.]